MMSSLAVISPGSIASIVVGATAVSVLYALHHLRAQPVRRQVATLIFWQDATRRQRARVPWAPRLTHFWTFLLLCLIVLAIAVSLSVDQWGISQARQDKNAMVIDIGAAMTATNGTNSQTLLSRSIQRVTADLAELPTTPAVISAGFQPCLVAQAGEALAIVKRKVTRLSSSGSASCSALALNLANEVIGSGKGQIYWYTDSHELPPGIATATASRVKIMQPQLPGEGVNIIGAEFVFSDNNKLLGTLHVQLSGKAGKPFSVEARIGDAKPTIETATITAGNAEVMFVDLPANGQAVSLKIDGAPGPAAEQTTLYQLPLHVPLRFAFLGSIPRPLRLALLAIGEEAAVSDANIIVAEQGQPIPDSAAAVIEVVQQGPAFSGGNLHIENGLPLLGSLSFEDVSIGNGTEVPATVQPLLRVGTAVVAGLSHSTGRKTLYLSQAIVSESSEVPRRAAFPVFLNHLSTDLAGWSSAPASVTSLRQVMDPLWDPGFADAPNTVFESLRLAEPSDPDFHTSVSVQAGSFKVSWINWSDLILGLALGLLVFEGALYAAKRIV